MSLTSIAKVMRISSFQLIGLLRNCIQIIHVTVHNNIISLKTLAYISYCSLRLGHFNHQFLDTVSNTCLLTLTLCSHSMLITPYHEPHALVHTSTCTCTFQHALINTYQIHCLHTYLIMCVLIQLHVCISDQVVHTNMI